MGKTHSPSKAINLVGPGHGSMVYKNPDGGRRTPDRKATSPRVLKPRAVAAVRRSRAVRCDLL
jgi:hypothetical protein